MSQNPESWIPNLYDNVNQDTKIDSAMPQDYSGQNLRGRSFKGQNLEGANFSGADIRSCDFSYAKLTGANFSDTKAGLQKQFAVLLLIILSFLSAISLYFGTFTQKLINLIFNYSIQYHQIIDWAASAVLMIFFIFILLLIIRQEFNSNRTSGTVEGFAGIFGFAFVGIIAIAIAVLALGHQAIAAAISVTGTFAFAGIFFTTGCIAVAAAGAVAGARGIAIAATSAAIGGVANTGFKNILGAGVIGLIIGLIYAYSAWKTLQDNEKKYTLMRIGAIVLAAFGGTSFYNANLTNANFTGATLKSTDLRKANLTHTCFHKVKKLDRIRPGSTYLRSLQIRQLLVTGKVNDKNFDVQNLQGVNFQRVNLEGATFRNAKLIDANFQEAKLASASFLGADMRGVNFQKAYLAVVDESFVRANLSGVNFQGAYLADVSFTHADLSKANLQEADLTRAKLVQTQLDGTDFTGATLTGAYIEDWGITTDTKFDGVRCEYVYMRLPTKENPDPHRKPDNREEVFADGDFGDFIKPIVDTLDLYHNQGVDPRAIAIAFKELAENNPEAELEIVAIERRGEDKILIRGKTAVTANKSELNKKYFINYNQLKALAENDFKQLIKEQEYQIRRLETMITTALERPSFYAQNYHNQGDTIMSEGSKKQSNFNLQGAQFAGGLVDAETVNAHQIGGNITNYTPEQKQNLAEAAAEIQQLLNQLGQTYPTKTPLEKQIVVTEALKQIDSNPTLKARVIGALKAGGTEAFKELIDNPLVNILLASIEGWQDAE